VNLRSAIWNHIESYGKIRDKGVSPYLAAAMFSILTILLLTLHAIQASEERATRLSPIKADLSRKSLDTIIL